MTRDRDDEAGFAGRWSRLKRRSASAGEAPAPATPAEAAAIEPAAEELSDDAVLEKLGLPDPETLKPGDDFSGFMAKAVPAHLRNRALRRLWLSDPVLANLDSLVDYGGDFTDKAMVVENLQTAYKVGRGMFDRAADRDAEAAQEPGAPSPASAGDAPEPGDPAEAPSDAGAGDGRPDGEAAPAEAEAIARATSVPPAREALWPAAPAPSDTRRQRRSRMHFRTAEE